MRGGCFFFYAFNMWSPKAMESAQNKSAGHEVVDATVLAAVQRAGTWLSAELVW